MSFLARLIEKLKQNPTAKVWVVMLIIWVVLTSAIALWR